MVVAFWDDNRLLAIGCLLAFYVAATLVTLFVLRQKAKIGSSLFAGTLSELSKDSDALEQEFEDVDVDFERRHGHG